MKKFLIAAVVAISALSFAGQALAAEAKGFIKSINQRTIVIQTNNAGQVNAPAGVEPALLTITVPAATGNTTDMMVGLSPGMTITVTYTTSGTGTTAVNTASKIVK